MGILVDQQLQDQAAGNPQGLVEVAQGRVSPCLPLEGLPSVLLAGLPLAWLLVVTVGETCGATVDLGASVAVPLQEVGVPGKAAAGLQGLGPGLRIKENNLVSTEGSGYNAATY